MDQLTGHRPRFSLTAEIHPEDPAVARNHFESKLIFEVDPADVQADMRKGVDSFTLVDARRKDAYEIEHVAGALSLPVRSITEKTTANLAHDRIYITYCDGPGCNASTKAAARLSALGFHVKEMIGGIEYWNRYGYPVESGR